jgi:hypothetical protein
MAWLKGKKLEVATGLCAVRRYNEDVGGEKKKFREQKTPKYWLRLGSRIFHSGTSALLISRRRAPIGVNLHYKQTAHKEISGPRGPHLLAFVATLPGFHNSIDLLSSITTFLLFSFDS